MGSTTDHKAASVSSTTVRNQEPQSPPNKKPRTIPMPSHPVMTDAEVASCFAPGLLKPENIEALADAYKTSAPYLHTCIPSLVSPSLLRAVRNEIEQHLVFTEKETDIFKVLQTGDLANIDGLSSEEQQSLTHLHQLRNALYSSQFRAFVSKVTGCGALSGTKQDLSINSYCQGSHLLNHDDVIGTRCVSYILYVPDPVEWDPAFGGALELYPCVSKGTPDVEPTLTLPPKWNQFIMFAVQPGYSFHSVQEVVAPHDRLSISGWFHIPQEGEEGYVAKGNETEGAPASLAQLEESEEVFPFTSISMENNDLTPEDCTYLSQFIHGDYLKPTSMEQITERFVMDSFIQLKEFLKPDYAQILLPFLIQADTRDGLNNGQAQMIHGTGIHPGWIVQGSPVHQRFMTLSSTLPQNAVEEAKKLAQLQQLFTSTSFHRWISCIVGSTLSHMRGRVRRFRPGLDYTLGTASKRSHSILDLTLTLTPDHECWEEGEYGGYECYIATDETNEDPAIYRSKPEAEEGEEEDDSTLLVTQASWNTLTIVLRDPEVMRFVKYVSARANGSRWDVGYEYLLQEDEDE